MTRLCSDCGREITAELVDLASGDGLADLGGFETFPEDPEDVERAEITATIRYGCGYRGYVDVELDGTASNLRHAVPESWAAKPVANSAGGDSA